MFASVLRVVFTAKASVILCRVDLYAQPLIDAALLRISDEYKPQRRNQTIQLWVRLLNIDQQQSPETFD